MYVGYQYYHLRKTPGALTAYNSNTTIQIGLQATSKGDPNNANYVVVSEALADALVTGPILTSNEFDKDVSNQINKDRDLIAQRYGTNADLGDVQNASAIGQALNAVRVHSLVTITTTWSTPAGAWAITKAVGEVSVAKIGTYLDYVISVLLLLVALAIGIALAFLLDYIDDRIRSKAEVTQLLGLPIYAEVPHAPTPGRSQSPKNR